jgi:hypothetical protein
MSFEDRAAQAALRQHSGGGSSPDSAADDEYGAGHE